MSIAKCIMKIGFPTDEAKKMVNDYADAQRDRDLTEQEAAIAIVDSAVEDAEKELAEVEAAIIQAAIDRGLGEPTLPTAPTVEPEREQAPITPTNEPLINFLLAMFRAGNPPKNYRELTKAMQEFDGQQPSPLRMKGAQEAYEAALTIVARETVAGTKNPAVAFKLLVDLYQEQAPLNVRTSTSISRQAYSTPTPIAYIANLLARIDQTTTVYEPTAGNGMLLLTPALGNVTANELGRERMQNLRAIGFGTVTQRDASKHRPAGPFDTVVANPPFGPTPEITLDGYKVRRIDHAISAKALASMKPDGRAVLIIAANRAPGTITEAERTFFNWLYSRYNVQDHFEVDGDLYKRQGAGWPIRIITIAGRAAEVDEKVLGPQEGVIERVDSWDSLYKRYEVAYENSRVVGAKVSAERPAGGRAAEGMEVGERAAEPESVQRPAVQPAGEPSPAAERPGREPSRRGEPPVGERQARQPVEPDKLEEGAAPEPAGEPARDREPGRLPERVVDVAGNEFQRPYVPKSNAPAEAALVPVSMETAVNESLNRLAKNVGDIDQYVMDKLGYEDIEDMYEAMSGLQIDAVAASIQAIDNGEAVIIGDQTGVGKGRQAAAVLRYAEKIGRVPVFITAKADLFNEMYFDLVDIGSGDMRIYPMNTNVKIIGKNNRVKYQSSGNRKRDLESMIATGNLPAGGALFMTYSQINKENIQRRALNAIAPNAIFVMDESHHASGTSATGEYMRGVLAQARGGVYLSATYAKRPDNMPLYFLTKLKDAVDSIEQLVHAMEHGGIPLQTVVSNMLARAGQLFRRERDFKGINIHTEIITQDSAQQTALADKATEALRAIVAADKKFHDLQVRFMDEQASKEGKRIAGQGNRSQAGVDHTQFSAVVHNFVRQFTLALKVNPTVDIIVKAWKKGEKPVIALENTMGSFLSEYVDEMDLKKGDPLQDFSWRTVLSRALRRSRRIRIKDYQGNATTTTVEIIDLAPEVRDLYAAAQDTIDNLSLEWGEKGEELPASPIDYIRYKLTKAGMVVGEITGRDHIIDYSEGVATLDKRSKQDKDRFAVRTRFNLGSGKEGGLDGLIINVAGSTGISIHASEKFRDQKVRHMFVVQAALDINTFIQTLGRINRKGQTQLPKFTILNADLPGEIRPTAVLSQKLKSLNANTTSSEKGHTALEAPDMLNQYGDQVVADYLKDTGLDTTLNLDVDEDQDIARKATGRLALLPVAEQRNFYDEVTPMYQELIKYLDAIGENDLVPRVIDLQAEKVKDTVLIEGKNPNNPFGQDAVLGVYNTRSTAKAPTIKEVKGAIEKRMGGKSYAEITKQIMDTKKEKGVAYIDALNAQAKDVQAKRERGEELAEVEFVLLARIGKKIDEYSNLTGQTQRMLSTFPIGQTFTLELADTGEVGAVIVDVKDTSGKPDPRKNPMALGKVAITFMLNAPSPRLLTVSGSQLRGERSPVSRRSYKSIDQIFSEVAAERREQRFIVTGNLISASAEVQKGRIVQFSTKDGKASQGLLLPHNFNAEKDTSEFYAIRHPAAVMDYLEQFHPRSGVAAHDGTIRIRYNPTVEGEYIITVPRAKTTGGKWFLNQRLLAITGDFVSVGKSMIVHVPANRLRGAIDVIMDRGSLYVHKSEKDKAKPLNDKYRPKAEQQAEDLSNASLPPQKERVKEQGMTIDQLKDYIIPIIAKWSGRTPVHFAGNTDELDVQRAERWNVVKGSVRGLASSDGIWLFADNIPDQETAERVLFHEMFGHQGLRALFKTEAALTDFLRRVYVNHGQTLEYQKLYALYRRAYTDAQASDVSLRLIVAEEFLAKRAENAEPSSLVNQLITLAREFARALGFRVTLTDGEIRHTLARARKAIEHGDEFNFPYFGYSMASIDENVPSENLQGLLDVIGKAKPTLRDSLRTVIAPGWSDRLKANVMDYQHGLKIAEETTGIDVAGRDESAYVASRLSTSNDAQLLVALSKGPLAWSEGKATWKRDTKGLMEILEPIQDNVQLFEAYMVARRSDRLYKEGRENLLTPEMIEEGKALGDKYPVFKDVAADWDSFNTSMLDFAEEAGIVSKEQRSLFEHSDYVPFYRIFDSEGLRIGDAKGIAGQYFSKRLKGGKSPINSIVENMIMNTAHLISASMKNNAIRLAVENLAGTGYMNKAPYKLGAALVPANQVEKMLHEQGVDTTNIDRKVFEGIRQMLSLEPPKGMNVVRVKIDGKTHFFEVYDDLLLRALTATNMKSWDTWMDVLRKPKRWLTTMVTLDPAFMAANFMRDTMHAFVVSRDQMVPLITGFSGAVKALRKSEDFWEMLAAGGGFYAGFARATDPGKTQNIMFKEMRKAGFQKTVLSTPRKIADHWIEIGSALENANRMAVYQAALKAGKSELAAAFEAKDFLDFSMRGDGAIIQFLVETVPFLNARLQGMARLGTGMKENPGAFAAKGSLLVLASVALWAINKDDDRYKELEEWDKDTYWHWWVGENHYRFPKPFEVGLIFGTVPERIMEAAHDKSNYRMKELINRFAWNALQVFELNPIPQAVRPIVEQISNKSFFTGRPIESRRMQGLEAEARFDAWTSETSIAFGKTLGISPARVDHIIRGYFGAIGDYALSASDIIIQQIGDYPNPPLRRIDEYPVVKRFVRDVPPRGTQYRERFFDIMKETEQAYNTVRQYKQIGKKEDARRVLRRERELIARIRKFHKIEAELNKLAKIARLVHFDKELTPRQKRDRLDQIITRRNLIYRKVVTSIQPGT